MPGPLQAGIADPVTLTVGVVAIAIVLLGVVVARILRANGASPSEEEAPLGADSPRGRICPDCKEVNEMDASSCDSCGRSFEEPRVTEP